MLVHCVLVWLKRIERYFEHAKTEGIYKRETNGGKERKETERQRDA